jgi:hypothetical protein
VSLGEDEIESLLCEVEIILTLFRLHSAPFRGKPNIDELCFDVQADVDEDGIINYEEFCQE